MAASLSYATLLWAIVMVFPKAFAMLFTSDQTLVEFTGTALRIYLALLFLFGIQMACQMTFNAIGCAKESITVAVLRKFILLIPLIYIMPLLWRSNQTFAVYLAEPVADAMAIAFTAILFKFRFKAAMDELETSSSAASNHS